MMQTSTPFWDRFNFTYQALGTDAELQLPLKLLILGDFSAQMDKEADPALLPVTIDQGSFNRVLAAQKIQLSIEVLQPLDHGKFDIEMVEIPLQTMEDFTPEHLVENIPYLGLHLTLIRELQSACADVSADSLSEAARQLLKRCGVLHEVISVAECDFICADINQHLHQILDDILHNERFQQLEAVWRSVWQLCQVAEQYDNCQVDLLDISKSALNDDFVANLDVKESLLFDVVYFSEFAQYGGQPYSAILADYEFGYGAEDIRLLRSIAQVGHAAHLPFIAGVSPRFFAEENFGDANSTADFSELISGPKYIKWRNLQREDWANYLGLTLPRIQLRAAHRCAAGKIGFLPYEEDVRLSASKSLLGNAAFGFAQCLIRSFGELGICTRISGEQGGAVNIVASAANDSPIEARYSERKLAELGSLGFLPLTMNAVTTQMYFPSAYSLRWGGLNQPGWQADDTLLDMQVEAQLPYLFVVARIAHYLKVVQRESLGSLQSRAELEAELNRWLRRYVSDVDNPAPGIRMRKPLKQAILQVMEDEEHGRVHMQLSITPHMKYQGQDFTLALNLSAE